MDDLLPLDVQTRGRIAEYMAWHHEGPRFLFKLFGPLVRNYEKSAELIKRSAKRLSKILQHLEAIFTETSFIAGNQATIADIAAYGEVGQVTASFTDLVDMTNYPRVQAWCDRMAELPFHDEVTSS